MLWRRLVTWRICIELVNALLWLVGRKVGQNAYE